MVAAIGSAIGFTLALPLPKLFGFMFSGLLFGAPAIYPLVLGVMMIVELGATLGPRAARYPR